MGEIKVNRLEVAWPRGTTPVKTGSGFATWSDAARSWEDNLETFITDHPRLTLATAVACGLLLGWMVKRK
jgi:hypothetical protein